MNLLTFEQIAKICHQANRAYNQSHDDLSLNDWENTSDDIKQSVINGVEFTVGSIVVGKEVTAEIQHAEWVKFKIQQGYVYGEVKDDTKKTHPCIVPFSSLPEFQRKKDELFIAIVKTFV